MIYRSKLPDGRDTVGNRRVPIQQRLGEDEHTETDARGWPGSATDQADQQYCGQGQADPGSLHMVLVRPTWEQ